MPERMTAEVIAEIPAERFVRLARARIFVGRPKLSHGLRLSGGDRLAVGGVGVFQEPVVAAEPEFDRHTSCALDHLTAAR
jgi:hypothetical protein